MTDTSTTDESLDPALDNDLIPAHEPTIFWIGCSDARVVPELIVPGQQIFSQRNIANQFHAVDGNALSCLVFSLTSLPKVTRIMVVGHTECAGVRACHEAASGHTPPLDSTIWKWLGTLKILASSLWYQGRRTERELIDENVKIQVDNIFAALHWLPPPAQGRTLTLSGHVYVLGSTPRLEQIIPDIIYPPLVSAVRTRTSPSSEDVAERDGRFQDLEGSDNAKGWVTDSLT